MDRLLKGYEWKLISTVIDGSYTIKEFEAPEPSFGPDAIIHVKRTVGPDLDRNQYHIIH